MRPIATSLASLAFIATAPYYYAYARSTSALIINAGADLSPSGIFFTEGSSACNINGSVSLTVVTVNKTSVLQTRQCEDLLVAEVNELGLLKEGWDGEFGAPAKLSSISDAMTFIQSAGASATTLEPSLHVDGSVILESEYGAFEFRGGGKVLCAVEGFAPQTFKLSGTTLPDVVKEMLEKLTDL